MEKYKPEFTKKMQEIAAQKPIFVGTFEDLDKFLTEVQEIVDGEHENIPDGMTLAEYIASLPDEA